MAAACSHRHAAWREEVAAEIPLQWEREPGIARRFPEVLGEGQDETRRVATTPIRRRRSVPARQKRALSLPPGIDTRRARTAPYDRRRRRPGHLRDQLLGTQQHRLRAVPDLQRSRAFEVLGRLELETVTGAGTP